MNIRHCLVALCFQTLLVTAADTGKPLGERVKEFAVKRPREVARNHQALTQFRRG